ncbi:hypothetical protein [Serinicoccus sediminis]|uniref:hypothetical protein n=1 Tax=Serinicoccus sediminis TaxID=2306021 RepID=UPI001021A2F2|nr:hypothetical protein [Serinicoccus sediminis]
MPLTYATTAELQGWLPPSYPWPDNADQLIRTASQLVRSATRTAIYDTTPAGLPAVGSDAADAMRDATLAQVEAWLQLAIDPAKGAADDGTKTVASKTIRGATISYAVYAGVAQARADAATHLCTEAALILGNAGLTSGAVQVRG